MSQGDCYSYKISINYRGIGRTTLEVIHNAQKYIPSKYYNTLKGLQLEDVIAHADDAGDFRFDI